MPDELWRPITVDHTEIEFVEHGSGDAIFLVHAGVFSDWFRFVGESVQFNDYRVVRLRRAGYGHQQPTQHLTLLDHAHHAAAVARHLDLSSIHYVGHSSSSLIGLALALDYPQLVRSLILLEPAAGARGFDVPASYDRPDFVGPALESFKAGDLTSAFDHFMRGVCGDGYRKVLEAHLGSSGLTNAIRESAFFFRDEIHAVLEWQFSPADATKIHQPVLCIEGGAQPDTTIALMSRQISERTEQLIPQTQVKIIPDVNHALPLQDPEAVAREIVSFIWKVT